MPERWQNQNACRQAMNVPSPPHTTSTQGGVLHPNGLDIQPPHQCPTNRSAAMRNTQRYNEHNQIARQSGTNVCRPWTRAEVEIARDRSLTVRQAAEKLGRTFNTVKHMRRPDNRRANELLATDTALQAI